MLLKAAAVRDAEGEIEAAVTIIEDVTADQADAAAQRVPRAVRGPCSPPRSTTSRRCSNVAGLAVPRSPTGAAWTCSTRTAARTGGRRARRSRARWSWPRGYGRTSPSSCEPDRGIGRVIADRGAGALQRDHRRAARRGSRRRASTSAAARGGDARRADRADEIAGPHDRHAHAGQRRIRPHLRRRRRRVRRADRRARRAGRRERAPLRRTRRASPARCRRACCPKRCPSCPDWEIAAMYRPAGHEGEVGGDFYDFWEVDGDWLMMIGDVTGKGVRAAAVTSLVRHTAWTASEFDTRPAHLLERVNAALRRRPSLSVCTALCLRIRGSHVTVASGRAPAAVAARRGGVRGDRAPRHAARAPSRSAQWPEESCTIGRASRWWRSPTASPTRSAARTSASAAARLRELLDEVRGALAGGDPRTADRRARALPGRRAGRRHGAASRCAARATRRPARRAAARRPSRR